MLEELKRKAKRNGWAKWIRSEADERAMLSGCTFDRKRGEYVIEFFETYLNHTMGEWAGQPFRLLDWQRDDVVMPLFGWKRQDGTRRYRKGDIFVAKKNGKSTLAAGLVLYFMLADGEPRAEVYGAAYTRHQAGIVYDEAAAMSRSANGGMPEMFKCLDSHKRILCKKTGSFYQVLAGEAGGVEGIKAHAVIFDEIHVQRNDTLWKALTYAKAARRQPMTLSFSTVGVADRTKIWWSRYEYAKGIISGTITDASCFAYIAQADEECCRNVELAGDREQWLKANPSLGKTVKLDQFEEDYNEARNSPVMFNAFLRYRLNVPTQQDERMIRMDHWDACDGGVMPDLSGRACFGGLDLADSCDLTAFVLYFPGEGDEPDYVLPFFWCPEDKLDERIKQGHGFYDAWRRDGLLRVTEGNMIDHEVIAADIAELKAQYDIREIGFDPWNAGDVATKLQSFGVAVVKVPQTMSGLALGTKRMLENISAKKLRHGGHAVLRWMANNAAGVSDHAGNVRPAKDKSADKIDGIVALSLAIGRASVVPPPQQSYYENNTLEVW